ncbi:MAG: efflux RND transporter permease subunit [bacterium]
MNPSADGAPASRALSLISLFSHHPVAANLLMAMMLMAGVWALKQLNTQFFPSYSVDSLYVDTTWSGASATDVEELITAALEQELRNVDFVDEITSRSSEGSSWITLDFEEGTDMTEARARVKQRVDVVVRSLPSGADAPEVSQFPPYEGVASLLVSGTGDATELRALVRRFEEELLARGIARVEVKGLPREHIAIEVGSSELRRHGLSLDEIGERVANWSRDVPVGLVGRAETSRQLRFDERRTSEMAFESVPLAARRGQLLTLGDIARIERKPEEAQESYQYLGKPAVRLSLSRAEGSDSLRSARIFHDWLADTRANLPRGVVLVPFEERWELLRERINLLVKNGVGGLVLVLAILFLFMSGRVAWWTAVGIPVSFMAALAMLYVLGGTINMISLFGLIMALGIIVDDAIVVGEEAMTQYEHGTRASLASETAARRMIGPVFSSSLTTIAAFMPLLLVGGVIGTIMQAIPTVVICVIAVSLVECFLVLPGHLTHSFRGMGAYRPGKARRYLDDAFARFRELRFRPLARAATAHRWSTIAFAMALLLVTVGWLQSGRIEFQFFPTVEADRLSVPVAFVSGTAPDKVADYLGEVERALRRVERESGEQLTTLVFRQHSGEHSGSVLIELTDPDKRRTRNRDIIAALRDKLPQRAGRESVSVVEPRAGPPGADIGIAITGDDIVRLKMASRALQDALADIAGVSAITDNTPYGREQLVLHLTPAAEALGLRVDDVSRQLRAAFDGYTVQELADGRDGVDVRVMLPPEERGTTAGLGALSIVLPSSSGGGTARIDNLASISSERGFDTILRTDGKPSVTVSASVEPTLNNSNRILAGLRADVLPGIASAHGVEFEYRGRHADQAETLGDMQLGMFLALGMIYLVLAWVFGSYGWPLVVMFIIPFGLVGAIWGHAAMGQDLTTLSLFGFFALSGIVINDSIILVVRYKQLRADGMECADAVVEAACLRLRAVLLTSLTTIAGLTPLLFETSLQAQFLLPMAITLAFGLAFATFLVLLLVPSLLLVHENAHAKLTALRSPTRKEVPA